MEDKIKKIIEALVLRKEVAIVDAYSLEDLEEYIKKISMEMTRLFHYGLENSDIDFVEKEGLHIAYVTPPTVVYALHKTQCTGE